MLLLVSRFWLSPPDPEDPQVTTDPSLLIAANADLVEAIEVAFMVPFNFVEASPKLPPVF